MDLFLFSLVNKCLVTRREKLEPLPDGQETEGQLTNETPVTSMSPSQTQ